MDVPRLFDSTGMHFANPLISYLKHQLEFVKLNVKIHRNNSVYRFGDLVQHGGSRWEQDSFTIETQPKYAHTILAEYLHMHMDAGKKKIKKKQMKEGHKQLAHLCQKHFKDRMSKASVAVHLRVGDEVNHTKLRLCFTVPLPVHHMHLFYLLANLHTRTAPPAWPGLKDAWKMCTRPLRL